MHFIFRIGFLMLSEALVLSEEKSEIFSRAFTIADMFVFEMLLLDRNFSRLKKEHQIPHYFLFLERVKIVLVGTASSHVPIFLPLESGCIDMI
jgi:hypothetical protein